MKPRIIVPAVVILFCLLLVVGIVNFEITQHLVTTSQQHWCDALSLLTKHRIAKPADPSKNPSRVAAYQFYQIFAHLRNQFGCRA